MSTPFIYPITLRVVKPLAASDAVIWLGKHTPVWKQTGTTYFYDRGNDPTISYYPVSLTNKEDALYCWIVWG